MPDNISRDFSRGYTFAQEYFNDIENKKCTICDNKANAVCLAMDHIKIQPDGQRWVYGIVYGYFCENCSTTAKETK